MLRGRLTAYSRAPDTFDAASRAVLAALAATTGVAVHHFEAVQTISSLSAQMRAALESRATIEQAKGVVMSRDGCTAHEAFQRLAEESQCRNVRLRQIAAEIVVDLAEDGEGTESPDTRQRV